MGVGGYQPLKKLTFDLIGNIGDKFSFVSIKLY